MKKVAIITVNYNGSKDTVAFLTSLKKLNTRGFDIKVIVVDNGSSDGSEADISTAFPAINLIQTGSNLGFAGGYNRGIEFASNWKPNYYFIINNDTLINSSNLIKTLIDTAEKSPDVGMVSPKIYFAKGYEYQKHLYKKNDLGKVLWYAGGSFDWNNISSIHRGIDEVDTGQYDQTQEVDFVTGCCILIKSEVINKVGAFDNGLFAYFEDNDLLQRVKRAGYKVMYCGSVSIYHKVSQTSGIGSQFSDYFGIRNRLIFGMRYACLRTKFALLRQAFYLLFWGRPLQRKGVWDFIIGKTGACPQMI